MSMSLPQPKYNIYPSLLDKFANYLNSSQIYQQTYGFSEELTITEEEFEAQKKQELLDGINRVPFESESADKGTMFNEVIDCIIEERNSDKMQIKKIHGIKDVTYADGSQERLTTENPIGINAKWKDREFTFNISDCKQIAKTLKGAVCQSYKEGFIETAYGFVKLYGYTDYIMPFSVVDLKTTKSYQAFKYRNHWQRIVYPFLMNFNGEFINDFTFLVYKWTKNGGEIYEENYTYNEAEDLPKLTEFVEQFIEFLEAHREQITDKKIFNIQ